MVTKKTTTKKSVKPKKAKKVTAPVQVALEIEETPEVVVVEETMNGNGNEKYFSAVGRRKESVARVRLFTKKASDMVDGSKDPVQINGKDQTQYISDVKN